MARRSRSPSRRPASCELDVYPSHPMLKIHAIGNWPRGAVRTEVAPSTRRIVPEVETLIQSKWREGQQRLGPRLFDGSMCRMESWNTGSQSLELKVSRTSYRIFFGTNLN